LSIALRSDLGATLRQATATAPSTVASLANASRTLVLPRRPSPRRTGTKVLGATCVNIACCSEVSLTVATALAGPPRHAKAFRSTRNSECPRRYTSTASGIDSAMRRKSSGDIALTRLPVSVTGIERRPFRKRTFYSIGSGQASADNLTGRSWKYTCADVSEKPDGKPRQAFRYLHSLSLRVW
jgi:hypothetical protein